MHYYILVFLGWTFVVYWLHRLVHAIPALAKFHNDHHRYINKNETGWHWSNLFLYNDTWLSTLDLWTTEVIPALVFSYFFGWWFFVVYYIWGAFIQEAVEHNTKLNLYPLTSGKWHMVHHRDATKNFGVFLPIWDWLFKTEKHGN